MTQRTAVVVGGASGIGKAVAHALAADSCRVIVADRNADGARSVATELGDQHSAATVEVTDEDSVRALFDQAGALDVVVNTAGYSTLGLITELPVKDFRSVVDVCLTGAFLVIKHAAPRLSRGGALVSISSLNGRQPAAAMSAYCAAKAGLSMLTQVAALELAPQGIRVNAVAPGFVHTPLTEPATHIPGVVAEYVENTPLGPARTAGSLDGPGSATSATLDVTDPAAVKAAVDAVVTRAGQLDLMFNNAGIAWGGDTELLTLDQWNAIIDVNIRGVVHGVTAAYPVMLRQGHGYIVNTASMAGLTPAGQITSYVMTKHAIVGLSLALRSEAVSRGVGVLAVCPGAVETPILDKGAIGGFVGRDYFMGGQI